MEEEVALLVAADGIYSAVTQQLFPPASAPHLPVPAAGEEEDALSRYVGNTATHCNTMQHTATHCNALQRTATHCNTLQHTATH